VVFVLTAAGIYSLTIPSRFVQPLRRSPAERLAAWVLTGPLGHLWSALADVVVLLARWGRARVSGRLH
jgi:hypothetical protein